MTLIIILCITAGAALGVAQVLKARGITPPTGGAPSQSQLTRPKRPRYGALKLIGDIVLIPVLGLLWLPMVVVRTIFRRSTYSRKLREHELDAAAARHAELMEALDKQRRDNTTP